MVKILFDLWQAQPLGGYKFHGGGEYIKSVYRCLLDYFGDKCLISVFYDPDMFLDDWIKELNEKKKIEIFPIKVKKDIQTILKKESFDVFYSGLPYAYYDIDIPQNTHFCGTIHGLRNIELPSDIYAYKYRRSIKPLVGFFLKKVVRSRFLKKYKKCITKLDSIICVSNHTKYAIKSFFPCFGKTVECFYTPQKVVENGQIKHLSVAEKYVLLISCNRFEKNSYRAIKALDELFSKGMLSDYKVVTVGKLPRKIANSIVNINRFVQLDYVSTEELDGLYADCDVFLYPTLNEGFGMPPLEAMKFGKTCVVSGVCSVPEVCGEAVYYVNPYDIDEIKNRILMASEIKISPEKIYSRLCGITNRQVDDLKALCEYIVGIRK